MHYSLHNDGIAKPSSPVKEHSSASKRNPKDKSLRMEGYSLHTNGIAKSSCGVNQLDYMIPSCRTLLSDSNHFRNWDLSLVMASWTTLHSSVAELPSDDELQLSPGDAIGPKDESYTVIRKLGSGGFSTVWLALKADSNLIVAVKAADADESGAKAAMDEVRFHRQLFRREDTGETEGNVARPPPLSSPIPIVRLLSTFEHLSSNGNLHHCLAFEPMDGSAWDFARKPTPLKVIKDVLRQTLVALKFLHGRGAVHGDLHPGNILTTTADVTQAHQASDEHSRVIAKLSDLGACKYLSPYSSSPHHTHSANLVQHSGPAPIAAGHRSLAATVHLSKSLGVTISTTALISGVSAASCMS